MATTGVTIWPPDGGEPSTGVLFESTSVLVQGELAAQLRAAPHLGVGLVVQLDDGDGDRSECVGVARTHAVLRGGPYVVLELAHATDLERSPFPPDILDERRAAVGQTLAAGGGDAEKNWFLCLVCPWRCR